MSRLGFFFVIRLEFDLFYASYAFLISFLFNRRQHLTGIAFTAYHTVAHHIAGTGIYIVQNITGMGNNKSHTFPVPYRAVFFQKLIDQFADQRNIDQINTRFRFVQQYQLRSLGQ